MSIFYNINPEISLYQLLFLALYAFLAGWERAGIRAALMPAIPLIVGSLGAVNALGYMIPILIVGDIFSVSYYKKHADGSSIKKLLPFAAAGIFAGMIAGQKISGSSFNRIIAVFIIISLGINLLNRKLQMDCEKKGSGLRECNSLLKKSGPVFSTVTGFVSMLGGSGGPVISTYYLITGVNKNSFIGTTAWFFFFVNLIKAPLYFFVWKNISSISLFTDLFMLPFLAAGIYTGVFIVRRINENLFRIIIYTATFISAVKLFF